MSTVYLVQQEWFHKGHFAVAAVVFNRQLHLLSNGKALRQIIFAGQGRQSLSLQGWSFCSSILKYETAMGLLFQERWIDLSNQTLARL